MRDGAEGRVPRGYLDAVCPLLAAHAEPKANDNQRRGGYLRRTGASGPRQAPFQALRQGLALQPNRVLAETSAVNNCQAHERLTKNVSRGDFHT